MQIGIVNDENQTFFHEILAEFRQHHKTDIFAPRRFSPPFFQDRVNRYFKRSHWRKFLANQDVVFFEWASQRLAAASQLPKRCGIVTRLHRYEMYQWVDKINWDVVDKIILVSQAKRREFVDRFDHLSQKIVVIPEAVSLDRFQPNSKPFSGDLGILCHMAPRKRVYDLILAFNEMQKMYPELRLHIGGGPRPMYPDYYPSLLSLVERLQLTESIIFYGRVEDPAAWYHRIDVFISNSYSEGLQVSPMEAMASGCYCLSHWWDGADELLPTSNLFFSEKELIEKVVEYVELSEKEKRSRCQSLTQVVQSRFNVDKTKIQIRELVEEVGRTWLE